MVGEWKKQAMEGLAAVFSDRSAAQETAKSSEAEVEKLHAKIGQLLVERESSCVLPAATSHPATRSVSTVSDGCGRSSRDAGSAAPAAQANCGRACDAGWRSR